MYGRKMRPEDVQRIAALFAAQGFDYQLPDLSNSNFLAKRVVTSGEQIICGAGARVTVEIYGWFDRTWETPGFRMAALRLLHEEMRRELAEKGITDAHAWLPPEVERSFGRRLVRPPWKGGFGWRQPEWKDFVREI